MNVLLIGGGGREHAIAWALASSPLLGRLFCAPGNAGIEELADIIPIDAADHGSVIAFCLRNAISLVVIGPEAPLVAGLIDDLTESGIRAFGPRAAAARLEASKTFAKDLCRDLGIPTARYASFREERQAVAHVRAHGAPIVVKADGLAAGKGVTVAATIVEAVDAVRSCFAANPGGAVVLEEALEGEEVSFFALLDGSRAIPLAGAQDHKRAFDGDRGPNTGGMGAYSPVAILDDAACGQVMDTIILPTAGGMAARGSPYRGILYAGLMLTRDGPKLIEYNARFGDPEAQVLIPRLADDLLALLAGAADGDLAGTTVRWRPEAALTVVLAARGYPGPVVRGSEIRGLERAQALPDVIVFHAATRRQGDRIIADGGRVLNVTALGRTVAECQAKAYAAVAEIDWPDAVWRTDIGRRAVEREDR